MNTSILSMMGLVAGDSLLWARSEFINITNASFSANARLMG